MPSFKDGKTSTCFLFEIECNIKLSNKYNQLFCICIVLNHDDHQ